MLQRQPPADRRPVVHDVHRVARGAELIEQAIDQRRVAIEGIGEGRAVRHVALAEAGIVRGDHVIAIAEGGDQVAEHVRRRRKAVQQQHDRRISRAGLTVEDADAIDFQTVIGGRGRCRRQRRRRADVPCEQRQRRGNSSVPEHQVILPGRQMVPGRMIGHLCR